MSSDNLWHVLQRIFLRKQLLKHCYSIGSFETCYRSVLLNDTNEHAFATKTFLLLVTHSSLRWGGKIAWRSHRASAWEASWSSKSGIIVVFMLYYSERKEFKAGFVFSSVQISTRADEWSSGGECSVVCLQNDARLCEVSSMERALNYNCIV